MLLGLGLSGAAAFVAEAILFPKSKLPASELRFVVLHHEGIDDPHFDLMLETAPGSPLATWRSPVWPIVGKTALLQLEEHRRAYLQYEGEISGGRGSVRRVREGTYTISDDLAGDKSGDQSTGAKRIALHPGGERIILRRINGRDWEAQMGEAQMGEAQIKGAADLSESTAPREGAK